MPDWSSCIPLRIVTRFRPISCCAHRCPPLPKERTVRAMNSRRWPPRNVFPVSTMLFVNPSVSSISLLLQLGRSNIPVTAEIWDTYLFPSPLHYDGAEVGVGRHGCRG